MTKQEMNQYFQNILTPEQIEEVNLYFEASEEYYIGEAMMSDSQFDELTEKLKSYNIEQLTQFVSNTIYRKDEGMVIIDKVAEYTQEMISLKKEKYKDKSSIADIKKFFIGNFNKQLKYGPKLDGAALKIVWNFNLPIPEVTLILSRGGLNITEQFKNHPDIRATKNYRKNIVCGELVIKKKIFAEKYSTESNTDYEYENPRNFCGSMIKLSKIPQEIFSDLHFIACTDGINALDALNVWRNCDQTIFYNLESMISFYKSEDFPYLCDGIVIAFDEEGINGEQAKRRVKDNYPLNMLAVKFPASRAKTKVIGFLWTQKKSGKLTPKVLIEHVKLDGSTLTCANGYNYQNVLDSHLGIGSEVEVEKSGDIIPVIARVITYSNVITMPDCEYLKEGKHLKALDMEESRKYKFILGLNLMNIEGIGPTLAESIGNVVDFDIIKLFDRQYKPNICSNLGGGVNWQRFTEFYDTKSLHLDKLIALLQFDGVGPVISKKIALLITQKSKDTSNISGDVINSVCKGEGFKKITDSIAELKTYGINVIAPIEISEDTISFEMTGDPPNMSKKEFQKKFQQMYPNSIHEGIKKDTKYLFCDTLTSTRGKANKARKYNIKMVLYSEALKNNLS